MGGSRRITWLVFIVGVVAVVDVLGWVTWQVLRLEREQAQARAEAVRQEALGRALWRMDSIVLPLLAVESARPFYEYQAFYAANRPLDQMWEAPREGDVPVPSPLLGEPGDFVLLHFEADASGTLASPQAPGGAARDAAIAAGVPESLLALAEVRLYELGRLPGVGALAGRRETTPFGSSWVNQLGAWPETIDALGSMPAALDPNPDEASSEGAFLMRLEGVDDQAEADQAMLASNTVFDRVMSSERELATPEAVTPGGGASDSTRVGAAGPERRSAPGAETTPTSAAPAPRSSAQAVPPAAPPSTVDSGRSEPPEAPPDQRQDYAARQQVVENLQNYNDAGRANRTRGLEQRQATQASNPGTSEAQSPPPAGRGADAPPGESTSSVTPAAERAGLDATGRDQPALGQAQARQSESPPPASAPAGEAPSPAPVSIGAPITPPTAAGAQGASDEQGAGGGGGSRAVEPVAGGAPADELNEALPAPLGDSSVNLVLPGPGPVIREMWPPLEMRPGILNELAGWSGESPTRDAGPLTPMWIGGDAPAAEPALVLVRQVSIGDRSRQQGVWIDWASLRRTLEASVSDLFPLAEVRPLRSDAAGAIEVQRLATIPAVLIPGPLATSMLPPTPPGWGPTRWTLLVGWLAVAVGVVAIGVVLRKAIELGERRGRFVSAVTHELRTPLTTFRLYSQMLAGGQVGDEAKRQRYAQTLDRESQRLSAIVESVLEYARLGRRTPGAPPASTSLAGLLERSMPALIGRAERGGMTLDGPGEVGDVRVPADADKFERVLLNLVDNACKYAGEASDKRIVLSCRTVPGPPPRPDRGRVVVMVRDFGPGVPERERGRIFRAFHRAKHHDASASPGLGLGLAIARGLAREMGGDLRLRADLVPGAAFEFELPVA